MPPNLSPLNGAWLPSGRSSLEAANPRSVRHSRRLERRVASAAKRGAVEELNRLLQRGGSPEAQQHRLCRDRTALMLAAAYGHVEAVAALVRAGADINGITRHERTTPLMQAARCGRMEVARFLLKAGAWIDVELSQAHLWQHTPLTLAVRHGHARMAHFLLDKGARAVMPVGSFAPSVERMIQDRLERITLARRGKLTHEERVSSNQEHLWLELLERVR